jgi:ribonuclease HI
MESNSIYFVDFLHIYLKKCGLNSMVHGSERGTNNTREVCAQIQALFYLANTTMDTPMAILFDSQYAAHAT